MLSGKGKLRHGKPEKLLPVSLAPAKWLRASLCAASIPAGCKHPHPLRASLCATYTSTRCKYPCTLQTFLRAASIPGRCCQQPCGLQTSLHVANLPVRSGHRCILQASQRAANIPVCCKHPCVLQTSLHPCTLQCFLTPIARRRHRRWSFQRWCNPVAQSPPQTLHPRGTGITLPAALPL